MPSRKTRELASDGPSTESTFSQSPFEEFMMPPASLTGSHQPLDASVSVRLASDMLRGVRLTPS